MGDTIQHNEGVQINVHTDEELVNGTPVVLVPHSHAAREDPITLGTGFESWGHLLTEIEYATVSGAASSHLPEDAASALADAEFEAIDVFTLAATAEPGAPEAEGEAGSA